MRLTLTICSLGGGHAGSQRTLAVSNGCPSQVRSKVDVVSSKPPSTYAVRAELLAPAIPESPGAFVSVTRVPVDRGKINFFYIPEHPLAGKDVVAVFPRINGVGYVEIIACGPRIVRTATDVQDAFIAATLDWAGRQPVLRIAVGGVDPLTFPYDKFRYSLEFTDGTTIEGDNYIRRESIVPWPKRVPVPDAMFHACGELIDVNGDPTSISKCAYRVNALDSGNSKPPKLVCERDDCLDLSGTGESVSGYSFTAHIR